MRKCTASPAEQQFQLAVLCLQFIAITLNVASGSRSHRLVARIRSMQLDVSQPLMALEASPIPSSVSSAVSSRLGWLHHLAQTVPNQAPDTDR